MKAISHTSETVLPAKEAALVILAMVELVGCRVTILSTSRRATIRAEMPSKDGLIHRYLVTASGPTKGVALHRASRELAETLAAAHFTSQG